MEQGHVSKWSHEIISERSVPPYLYIFHNVAVILPRLGRISTAETKCWENQLKAGKFWSMATTVLGHGETVRCVGGCGGGYLVPAGEGKERGRVRILQRMLRTKSGSV